MDRTNIGAGSLASLALATVLSCGAQQSPGGGASGASSSGGAGGHGNLASIGAQADALLAPLIDGEWATGLAVGLIRGDEVHFAGYGHTAAGAARPDENTLFEIGSATKVFTSLL